MKYILNIDNYRSFKNQSIDFDRVNILIGENSSGKSSLIKFLLVLKQSLENNKDANLLLNGEYTDVGNYYDMIHYHKDEELLTFGFIFQSDYFDYYKRIMFFPEDLLEDEDIDSETKDEAVQEQKMASNIFKDIEKSVTSINFTVNCELENHTTIKTKISNPLIGELEIVIDNNYLKYKDSLSTSLTPSCTLNFYSKKRNKKYVFNKVAYEKKAFLSIIESYDLNQKCLENDDEEMFYEIAFLLVTQNFIEKKFNNLEFVNPLFTEPQRIYLRRDSKSQYKKNDIDKFINLINGKKVSPSFLDNFQNLITDFGLADGLIVKSSKQLPVSELKIKIKNLYSNIYDVGYGVSLQLPILFEALLAEQNGGKTIVIEQPEVHLHPKLQAKFIETLLSIGNKNQYIIETHSEHIIRKLQVIVKQKLYNTLPNEINIYYFSREKNKSDLSKHSINDKGKLNPNFPSGFFDSSYLLAKELL